MSKVILHEGAASELRKCVWVHAHAQNPESLKGGGIKVQCHFEAAYIHGDRFRVRAHVKRDGATSSRRAGCVPVVRGAARRVRRRLATDIRRKTTQNRRERQSDFCSPLTTLIAVLQEHGHLTI